MCTELTFNFFRRSAFEKIGYFDERWKAGYENGDWGTRAFLAGLVTGISLDSFIWHYLSMAHKSLGTLKTYEGYIEMGTEHTHIPLKKMWEAKWPRYTDFFPIWNCVLLNGLTVERCPEMVEAFKHNIYLPFVQEVGY
jgi:GT2 family glycosyltransferase